LIEELRAHIYEALDDKVRGRTGASRIDLLNEAFEELGSPEDIADEFGKVSAEAGESAKTRMNYARLGARLFANLIIMVLAAWFVSSIRLPGSETHVDFWVALLVFALFAVVEWYLRSWQASHR
jgi:hypothetical protein